jgi:hypothetical protein
LLCGFAHDFLSGFADGRIGGHVRGQQRLQLLDLLQ